MTDKATVRHTDEMETELIYPHIEKKADTPAALRRLGRIRVAQIIMDYLFHGMSAEEICRQYSHLQPAEAHTALAYYYDHQSEIEAEIQAEIDEVDEQRKKAVPSAFFLRMKAKGAL